MKVLVVGAGASGLVTAIKLKERNIDVTIIDKNPKIGKKLALTGNGRCNFWNEEQTLDKYYGDLTWVEKLLKARQAQVLPFFDSLGIVPKVVNGYYYPYSNHASSIVKALENKITKLNIPLKLEEEVLDIEKNTNFKVTTSKGVYNFERVVLAMGSKAWFSSTGYDLAIKLGHTVNKVTPALVGVIGKAPYYKDWEGVRSEAILTLVEDGLKRKEERGEVQFTKLGLSGICTFNLSGLIAQGLSLGKKEELYLNLVPWFQGTKEDFKKFMKERSLKLKDLTIKEILEGFLNYKLVKLLLKLANIKEEEKWEDIAQDKLINYLINFKFNIKDVGDFKSAQICYGGVSLKEIEYPTFESKLVKGLYFTGEILDIHGDCGGYNLGLAWMSGLSVGENLK